MQNVGSKASSLALISSAFCKKKPFEELCKSTQFCQNKVLVVRWQFCDLISGVSDLEIYEIAKKYGYKLYFNQQLHAKAYLFDDVVFLGSSNLTNKGLYGGPPQGNIELSVKLSKSTNMTSWFNKLIETSVFVDQSIFESITEDVNKYKQTEVLLPPTRKGFSQSVLKKIRNRVNKKGLYLSDFPLSQDPEALCTTNNIYANEAIIHDLNLLGLQVRPNLETIKTSFMLSATYSWLNEAIETEMYFGKLTSILHDSLCDETTPYRKEVKERLSNLISWSKKLCPEVFVVDRPKYSQRIIKICD